MLRNRYFFAACLLLIGVFATYMGATWRSHYWLRTLVWNTADVEDYRHWPADVLEKQTPAFMFPSRQGDAEHWTIDAITLANPRMPNIEAPSLPAFLEQTNTTAFIVIKNGQVAYEDYFNGHGRDSMAMSFSVTKSYMSALVGFAIADGFITDEYNLLGEYLPELADSPLGQVSIRHLMTMTSGIKFKGSMGPFGDFAHAYFEPDLQGWALRAEMSEKPGKVWRYNNYNLILLGMAIERATGQTVAGYLEHKLWRPLSHEFDGSFSLDHTGFAMTPTGINARAIDFAKLGILYLNEGLWNGATVLEKDWVNKSTQLFSEDDKILRDIPRPGLSNRTYGYKYFWRVIPDQEADNDFFAFGLLGQFIYVSPANNTVIVRLGKDSGGYNDWTHLFEAISALE